MTMNSNASNVLRVETGLMCASAGIKRTKHKPSEIGRWNREIGRNLFQA